tara:strand:+ start:193 stop:492 length:300 start_codon:yes stop_codon:yes gene_type:complete
MPKSGVELTSTELAAALETKTGFTTEEWAAFGIADLQFDHFVKAGGKYYQPFEIPEGFRPSMRSQRNGRPHARTPVLQVWSMSRSGLDSDLGSRTWLRF